MPATAVPMSIAGIAFLARIVKNSRRGAPATVVAAATAAGVLKAQINRTA